MPCVLDTHAALWYLLDDKRLPASIFSLIDKAATDGTPTYISAVSLVEVAYLVERNRLPTHAFDLLIQELEQAQPTFIVAPLDSDIAKALRRVPRVAVPDMPDRIIAATALHLQLPLVTRDRQLRSAGLKTIW